MSAALVAVDPTRGPDCAASVDVEVVDEPALFLHGGYGATRSSTHRYCRCGWWLLTSVDERRPTVNGSAASGVYAHGE